MTAAEATVFVVDDDPAVRESLRMSLKLAGHTVEIFESAKAFLASKQASGLGCLVTDIRMPDMDGLELQEELARRRSSLSVIVITGHADIPLAVRAMKAGAVDFLEKPFQREVLLASINRALEMNKQSSEAAGQAAEMRNRVETLTPREREVFDLVVAGMQSKVIARELGASARTIDVHRARMMNKLKAQSLQELVRIAIVAGVARA